MSVAGPHAGSPLPLTAVVAFAFLLVIGTLDYATGWELSVSLLYALIVLGVSWYGTRSLALIFAVMSTCIWWWANRAASPYVSQFGYIWATVARLAYFLIAAFGGSALRMHEETNRERIAALERAVALEHEVARISEHEQRRIGQDLHDGICQELAAIRFGLSSLREDMHTHCPQNADDFDNMLECLRSSIDATRNLARGIFPAQLEEIGLAAMIDELVANVRKLQGIEATFSLQGDVAISDPEVATHLYRITQEALNNATRHGKAQRVSVLLACRDGVITLEIRDDGEGLNAENGDSHGMGLKTMNYRARIIGAKMEIRNVPPRGVSVSCHLRVDQNPVV